MFPKNLQDGYQRFISNRFSDEHQRYELLADKGQKPSTLLIGCSDSRVSPTVIFDVQPGEIFVVRNIANIVPPYTKGDNRHHGTSAALEYAVALLKVKNIVVLGHASCGGIHTFASKEIYNLEVSDFIDPWIRLLEPAHKKIIDGEQLQLTNLQEYLTLLELESIKNSIENLKTFPFIRKRLEEETLSLNGAFFSVASGDLLVLDLNTGLFKALERGDGNNNSPKYFGIAEPV